MSTPESMPVFNSDRLRESASDDADLMRELVALYLEHTESQLPDLAEAVALKDAERTGRVAHGIKGASAAVGAEEAAELFRQLEVMGREGRTEGMDGALDSAQQAFQRAREVMRNLAA